MTRDEIHLPTRTEASIEAAACEKIQAKYPGVIIRKLGGIGDRHWPDRMILLPRGRTGHGHAIFLEFKQPGEEPTPGQRYMLQQLLEAGFDANWCASVEQAVAFVDSCVRRHR